MGVCNCSMFCCTLLYVHSSIAIILMGKRELVALLNLSSWCLVMVEWLFPAVPWGFLRFVIVVFHDHTYLLSLDIHRFFYNNFSVTPMRILPVNKREILDKFKLLQTFHLCTQKSVCAKSTRPFEEVGEKCPLRLSSWSRLLKLKVKDYRENSSKT